MTLKPTILCLMPALKEDLNPECLDNLNNQTVKVNRTLIISTRFKNAPLQVKVATALNEGLKQVNLDNYDYILRMDGHTILPLNFIQYALNKQCDMFGNVCYAMLIKTSVFQKLMGGYFHPESDETYLTHKFTIEGYTVSGYDDLTVKHPKNPHGKLDHNWTGQILYRLGYEPLHILHIILRNPNWISLYVAQGYFIALIARKRKFDVASKIWSHQISRLIPQSLR